MIQNFKLPNADFGMGGKYSSQLPYMLGIPVFFMVFSIFYTPFNIQEFYDLECGRGFPFHITMLSCIIMGVLGIYRTMLHFILKASGMGWFYYICWCFMEVLGITFFMALYTALIKHDGKNYFQYLAYCLKYSYLELVFIYVPMSLARAIKNKNELLEAKRLQEDGSLLRFHDEHQRLKLTIAPSSLLFVKSESNYLKIYYMEAGKVREFTLRASMKSLEIPAFAKALVRCQRSYFVNPEHVTVLRKDRDGFMFAEMNIPDIQPVPVSKQYFNHLSELL